MFPFKNTWFFELLLFDIHDLHAIFKHYVWTVAHSYF